MNYEKEYISKSYNKSVKAINSCQNMQQLLCSSSLIKGFYSCTQDPYLTTKLQGVYDSNLERLTKDKSN